MIEELIGAFQLKRDIHMSPDDAASILETVSYLLDKDDTRDTRHLRIPLRLASGDSVGDYLFVPMTVLDVSIALAIDQRQSITPIFSSTMSKSVTICDKSMLVCKIKKDGLKYKDFLTVCLITNGIPNFRARCESIISISDNSFDEITRFTSSKEFKVDIVRLREEGKFHYHKFTIASLNNSVEVSEDNLLGALAKFAAIDGSKISDYALDPVVLEKMIIAVDTKNDQISEMNRYKSGGNKIVNIGCKVVAKPTNLMQSKVVGTVIGKSANIINVKWDAGHIRYDLDNPKTYFLIEFVD